MHSMKPLTTKPLYAERRRSPREFINRVAQIRAGAGTLPRDCLITDISGGGVRLHVEGFEVPEEFVLAISGQGVARECMYRVVWRLGNEVGASLIGFARRPSA
jgi:hypothetical protein